MKYMQNLYQYVKTERTSLYSDSWFQNQIDEIEAQIARTIYLLTLKK
jgi:hypothetical protein